MANENHKKSGPSPVQAGEGYGGKMTDSEVRGATKFLEACIVDLQKKRGMNTFVYRASEED